jgi:hypothetical protein
VPVAVGPPHEDQVMRLTRPVGSPPLKTVDGRSLPYPSWPPGPHTRPRVGGIVAVAGVLVVAGTACPVPACLVPACPVLAWPLLAWPVLTAGAAHPPSTPTMIAIAASRFAAPQVAFVQRMLIVAPRPW